MTRPKGRFVTPRDAPRPPGKRPIGRPRKEPKPERPVGSVPLGRPRKNEATAGTLDAGLGRVVGAARLAPASSRTLRSASGPAEDENAARPVIGNRGPPRRGDEASQTSGAKRRRTATEAEAEDEVVYVGNTTDSDSDSVFETRSPRRVSMRPRDLRGDISDETVQEPRAGRPALNDRFFHEHPERRYPSAMTVVEAESALGLISAAREMTGEDEEAARTPSGDDRPGVDDTHLRVDGESQEWLQLWRTTLHLFRAAPHDLFTWGLRIAPTVTEGESRRLWRDLEALMTHPLWDGRLYAVRYFLQKAVCLRVPGHVEPLCPLAGDHLKVLAALRSSLSYTGLDSATCDRAISDMTYDLWTVGRPEAYEEGGLLSSEMQLTARDQLPAPEASVSDDTLFFMERRDVALIRESLDSLRPKWNFGRSVYTYGLAYSGAASTMLLLPSSRQQMMDWDRRCAANRSRDRAAKGPDVPKKERLPVGQEWYWQHRDCDDRFALTLYAVSRSDDHGGNVDDEAAALETPFLGNQSGGGDEDEHHNRQATGGSRDR
ncbi:hypothetical protein DL769_007265 [Monosporascus sp. CRB-8-3]|nr:hypothetical protein DL769_007265 [Monosporascus sp. CRB-8-3]